MKMSFMLFKPKGLTCVLILVGLVAVGCSTPTATSTSRLQIVTSFYPLQFIAEEVAGGLADVSGLTQPGTEPHDVELAPRQVASVGTADLVIYERTFQPAVDEAVTQGGTDRALDTTTVVPLRDEDPHVWLDPTNMATIATAVADRLAEIDPANTDAYRQNAAELGSALQTLDQSFAERLAQCQRREFITTHAAFGYLARRYDLTEIGINGLSPESQPSPARIADVQRQATEHGVTTIFYETLVSPAVAESLAGDLGLATDVLDPIEGITDQSRGTDYLSVMESNLDALARANGCR